MQNINRKTKKDKYDFLKSKNFGSLKGIIQYMRRQGKDWGKIFAEHISNK